MFGCFRGRAVVKRTAVVQRAVVVQQVVKAVPVAISPDYYYSTASYYQNQLLADAIAYRVLVGMQAVLEKNVPPAQNNIQGMPKAEDIPPPGNSKGDTTALQKVVNQHCIRCHGASLAAGAQTDFRDLSKIPRGRAWEATAKVISGAMPKGKESLPDADTKLFYDWADGK